MKAERVLDVSQLEPCEPMERILHRMEPHPLYPILTREGFAWLTQPGREVPVEISIWRSNDTEAEATARNH